MDRTVTQNGGCGAATVCAHSPRVSTRLRPSVCRRSLSGTFAMALLAAAILGHPSSASSGEPHYVPPAFTGVLPPCWLDCSVRGVPAGMLRHAPVLNLRDCRRRAPPPFRMSADGGEESQDGVSHPLTGTGGSTRQGRPAGALQGMLLSRRSAVGFGILGFVTLVPTADGDSLASILPKSIQEGLRPPPPSKAEEAAKKGAKALKEARSVDSAVRKEMVQIRKEMQTDTKALQNGLDARFKTLQQQLVDGNGKEVLPGNSPIVVYWVGFGVNTVLCRCCHVHACVYRVWR
jgi:hypothetical protein